MRMRWVLAISLLVTSSRGVFANPVSGREMAKLTHDLAKQNAEQALNAFLFKEMASLLQSQGLSFQISQVIGHLEAGLSRTEAAQMRLQARQSLLSSELPQLNSTQIENIYVSLRDQIRDLSLLQSKVSESLLVLGSLKSVFYRISRDLSQRVSELCRDGMMIPPNSEVFPVVMPVVANYGFYFQTTVVGDPQPSDWTSSGVTFPDLVDTPEEQALWALASQASYIVSLKLMTGKWILTGATTGASSVGGFGVGFASTASVSSAKLMAAAAASAAVMLAVAVMIIAIDHVNSVSRSARAVRNAADAFHGQATKEDSVRFFKASCEPVGDIFSRLYEKLLAIESKDPAALRELESISATRMSSLSNYMAILRDYNEKQTELMQPFGDRQLNEAEEKELIDKLRRTPEHQRMVEQTEALSPVRFAEYIEMLILAGFKSAMDQLEDFGKMDLSRSSAERLADFRHFETQVWDVLRDQKIREALVANNIDWQSLLKEDQDVARLLSQLDTLALNFVQMTVDDLITGVRNQGWQDWGTRRAEWELAFQNSLLMHPNSKILLELRESLSLLEASP